MAADNRSVGQFKLDGIPPAPRGMPQIEVTFDIDTNGILNVTAKDKATDKEQSIRIEGSSGLSETEINRMTQEAEENAEADKSRKEAADTRNQADALIHQAEKSIKEYGEKIGSEELAKIEASVNSLKENLKGDDAEVIKKSIEEVAESLQVIGKIMYEESAKQQAEQGDPNNDPSFQEAINQAMSEADAKSAVGDNTVDAEVVSENEL